jgi:LysM repeat protein
VPPFSSTGGDIVDQLREWFDRQRERFAGPNAGGRPRLSDRRAGRRSPGRTQAVPLGTAKTMVAGRPVRAGRGRNDRAARGAYTLILGAVLVVGVIALFFAVSWALGSANSSASTPVPSGTVTPLPNPAAQSPPPPFPSPSPSPSPTVLPPPQQRTHVVEGGDTLNRIAQRYGVTVEAIMQANGFTDRNRILRIGERLTIPDAPVGSPVPVPR